MYTTMFAFSYAMEPSSLKNGRRTILATSTFATGAIAGWPFAIALAIPFVYEELFIFGGDLVSSAAYQSWIFARWKRLARAGILASLIFVSHSTFSHAIRLSTFHCI